MTSGAQVRRRLTRFPYAVSAYLLLLAAAALAFFWERRDVVAAAWCHGDTLMQPGDSCSRRSRRFGTTTWESYDMVLAQSRAGLTSLRVLLVLVAVLALALTLGTVLAWRRDVALAGWLAQEEPLVEHVSPVLWITVLGMTITAGLVPLLSIVGFGAVAGGLAGDSPGGVIGGSILVLGVAAVVIRMVPAIWPRGSSYVGVPDEGVRFARKGRVSYHPWRELQLLTAARKAALGVVGEKERVDVPADLLTAVQDGIDTAWRDEVWRLLDADESVDFGSLTLRHDSLTVGANTLRLEDLTEITLDRGSKGTPSWTFRRGVQDPLRVSLATLANVEVLSDVLEQLSGHRPPRLTDSEYSDGGDGRFRA